MADETFIEFNETVDESIQGWGDATSWIRPIHLSLKLSNARINATKLAVLRNNKSRS